MKRAHLKSGIHARDTMSFSMHLQLRRLRSNTFGMDMTRLLTTLIFVIFTLYLSGQRFGRYQPILQPGTNFVEAAPVASTINTGKSPSNSAVHEILKNSSRVEEPNRPKAKTFIVLFMGHSGSTAFITELRAHSAFEIEKLEPVDHGEYEHNTDLALKQARQIFDSGIGHGKVPGFKLRPLHIARDPEAWRTLFKEYDTRIIWQFRENLFKMAIGEYRHRVLNDSSVVEGLKPQEKPCEDKSQRCTFEVRDMNMVHFLLNDFSKSDEMMLDAVQMIRRDENTMTVKYEDYLYRREETMKETFDFLGVSHENTTPQRIKASPDSLCDMVSNFDEVCHIFYPCQLWRTFMDDPVNNCRCRLRKFNTFDRKYCFRETTYAGRKEILQ